MVISLLLRAVPGAEVDETCFAVAVTDSADAVEPYPYLWNCGKSATTIRLTLTSVAHHECPLNKQILDQSGIVLVPGSGFGQEEGTLHFRTTFLPAEATMHETLKNLATAHGKFMDEHRD